MMDSQGRWKPFHNERDKFPCRNCTERSPGCHDRCERYNAVKRESDLRKQVEREKRMTAHGVNAVQHSGYLAVKHKKPKER